MIRNSIETLASIYTPKKGWSQKTVTLSLNPDNELQIEFNGVVIQISTTDIDELHEDTERYSRDPDDYDPEVSLLSSWDE